MVFCAARAWSAAPRRLDLPCGVGYFMAVRNDSRATRIESMTKSHKIHRWQDLPDEDLLGVRIRNLKLQIAGSWLEPLVERLYGELDGKGISYHPPCYLADGWVPPRKNPHNGISFCPA